MDYLIYNIETNEFGIRSHGADGFVATKFCYSSAVQVYSAGFIDLNLDRIYCRTAILIPFLFHVSPKRSVSIQICLSKVPATQLNILFKAEWAQRDGKCG